ncbi:MAG TPA: hypothetical protein DDW23_05295 [Planctomycetes bacterium]|nr:hypothetical protein [Planctomycetota bacterium]
MLSSTRRQHDSQIDHLLSGIAAHEPGGIYPVRLMYFIPLLLGFLTPQTDPTDASSLLENDQIARWNGGALEAARYERFLGRTFRGKKLGQEALAHLLQVELVRREANSRELTAPNKEIEARMAKASDAAERMGTSLETLIRNKGLTLAGFQDLLRDSVLHEMLVQADLDLPKGTIPSPQQLHSWTEERTNSLLEISSTAPLGMAIEHESWAVTEAEVGAIIRASLPDGRNQEYLEQLVLQLHLPIWGAEKGLILTDDVLEEEIEWRQSQVAGNPVLGGATYETLLASQGSSLESVRAGAELRVAGWLRILSRQVWDANRFENLSAEERADLNAKFGESRSVSWFLLRAVTEKSGPLDRSFEEASTELLNYASSATNAKEFGKIAGLYSEDEASRVAQGKIGWLHRIEPGIDPAILEAAFSSEPNALIGPIRTVEGQALAWVNAIQPAPDKEVFRNTVRRSLHQEMRQEILTEIGLKTIYSQ